VGHEYSTLDIKATNTPSEYVIFIAFPPQQWLQESVSILRYTYITCRLFNTFLFLNLTLVKFCIVCSAVCIPKEKLISQPKDEFRLQK